MNQRPTAWRYRHAIHCPPCLIEALVVDRLAAPAALDMDSAQVVDQVTETYALDDLERPHPLAPAGIEPGQRCDVCHDPLPSPPPGTTNGPGAARAPARRVTIWLNEHPSYLFFVFGHQPGDPLRRAYDYELHAPDVTPAEIAEQAFRMFNDMPATSWKRAHTERYYAAENRSLSVGDLVVVDGAALACQRAGLTPIPLPANAT